MELTLNPARTNSEEVQGKEFEYRGEVGNTVRRSSESLQMSF